MPEILVLYRADHRKHVIIRRKLDTLLEAGFRIAVVDQAAERESEPPADYRHVRSDHLTWRWLTRLVWPAIHRIESSALSDLFWWWVMWLRMASNGIRLGWAAARVETDCYVAEDLQSALAALIAARLRRCPAVYDAHEVESEQGCGEEVRVQQAFLRRMEKRIVPRVDRLVVPNKARASVYEQRYGVASEPVVILNCPPASPALESNKLREDLRLAESARVVLYHGALIAHRALDNLVRSAALFDEGIVLVLIGQETSYMQEVLTPLRAAERLEERVRFLPYVHPDEMPPYVASADLGVVIYENVNLNNFLCAPTKLYEFIQQGVPVAACDFPELRRQVEQQGLGVVFDPADPRSIASAVNQFFRLGVEERSAIGRALEDMATLFTWEREGAKWLTLLEAMIN